MYKLVAIDLDGTMLNPYGIVTQRTKEAIRRLQENGLEVMIASGRTMHSIQSIAKEIKSEKYYIAGNGAIVYDIKNNQIIYENTLKKNTVLDIIKICEENSIYYNIYTENEIIAKSLKYNALYYNYENLTKSEEDQTSVIIIDNIYDYIKEKENKIIKITICDSHQTIFNSIIKKMREISEIEILEVSHMSRKIIKQGTEEVSIEYFYTEISAKDVDKWNAIEFLMKRENISKEEIIAIGDNINDKKMIENAKLGVAMGQSTPKIKEIADEITADNSHEGVAKILEKLGV